MIRTTCSNPTTFFTQPLQIVNGQVALSDKPGLGIELNREKLDAFKRCDVRESVFFDTSRMNRCP